MTIGSPFYSQPVGLLSDDDVLPSLLQWQREGLKTALVTLVGVEGGAPRQAGAQMAVAQDGRYHGYLSGGCLEAAVADEAAAVIASGQNRLVRYGRGSPYFDIKLPCGSGLDLYFDQGLDAEMLQAMQSNRAARRPFQMRTSLDSGQSALDAIAMMTPMARSTRDGAEFRRVHAPPVRLLLLGTGPSLVAIAALAQATGLSIAIWSPDDATQRALRDVGQLAHQGNEALEAGLAGLDAASAAVLVFHDHDAEPDILARLLKTDCFYIGVLGNHAVHRQRLEALQALGFDATVRSRLRAPIGAIPGAKSKATLAAGVLAELLDCAKSLNLVA